MVVILRQKMEKYFKIRLVSHDTKIQLLRNAVGMQNVMSFRTKLFSISYAPADSNNAKF